MMKTLKIKRGKAIEVYGAAAVAALGQPGDYIEVTPQAQRLMIQAKLIKEGRIFPYNVAYVYVMDCPENGCSKVGFSESIRARLSTIQGGNASKVSLIGVQAFRYTAARNVERGFLNLMRRGGKKKRGEWFDVEGLALMRELVAFVDENYSRERLSLADIYSQSEPLMRLYSFYARDRDGAVEQAMRKRDDLLWLVDQMS